MRNRLPRTADLADEHGDRLASCETQFKEYGAVSTFAGRISTVRCYEDNAQLRAQLEQPADGRVLVVDGGGSVRVALVGDTIAHFAHRNGWSGLVIWGAVRDVDALAKIKIGIKALGSSPCKGSSTGAGLIDVPVSFGGATFRPGDWLVSDSDGIVVITGDAGLKLGPS